MMKEMYWRRYNYIGNNINDKAIGVEAKVEIEIRV